MKPTRPLLEPQVEDLLAHPFEELSLEERTYVLTEMSQREFNELREIAASAKAYLAAEPATLSPRPELQDQLRKRIQQRQALNWRGRLTHAMRYPVPAWQAAAAMAFLAVAVYFGTHTATMNEPANGPHHILVDSTLVDSSLRHPYPPIEDSMVHLTSETL